MEGNTAANGTKYLSRVVSPTEIDLVNLAGQPVIGNGAYTGGGELHSQQNTVPERARFGCSAPVGNSFLRDFTIKLPPGFLGNPTAVTPCPTHLWYAGACPDRSQLGHAFAEAIAGTGSIIEVPTSVFALQTMGLEPARLGTEVVPAVPPGPLVNTVTIRTTGDYGIDSQQINLPKELGGDAGRVRSIQVVLCDRAPCQETGSSRTARFRSSPRGRSSSTRRRAPPPPVGRTIASATAGVTSGQPSDVVLTMSGDHNLPDGAVIKIEGATGSQAALNGTWNVTVPSPDTLGLIRCGARPLKRASPPTSRLRRSVARGARSWRRCHGTQATR